VRQLDSVLNKLIRDIQTPETIESAREQGNGANGTNGGAGYSAEDSLIINSFIRDANKAIAVIESMCDNSAYAEDSDMLRKFIITTHGIKSSLNIIGENALSEAARSLELAGRERNAGLIWSSAPVFLTNLRALLDKLEANLDINSKDRDIQWLRGKMLSIEKLCAEYDRKGVLDIIAGMGGCSRKTREITDKIAAYTLHSEFEEAAETAAGYALDLSSPAT
jgi:HPt (histidine-containing phosphotransfer) domain-containing protein